MFPFPLANTIHTAMKRNQLEPGRAQGSTPFAMANTNTAMKFIPEVEHSCQRHRKGYDHSGETNLSQDCLALEEA